MRKAHRGITVIGLLIALAMIGILTGIAIPSYRAFLERGRLAEGPGELADARLRMEQAFQENRSFQVNGVCAVDDFTTERFTFACVTASPTEFVWTATNRGGVGLGDAGDYVYTIDQAGDARTLSFDGTGFSPGKPCWMARPDQC